MEGVGLLSGVTIVEINDKRVTVVGNGSGLVTLEADSVINASEWRGEFPMDLIREAEEMGVRAFVIGKAGAPISISDAIHDGFATALEI